MSALKRFPLLMIILICGLTASGGNRYSSKMIFSESRPHFSDRCYVGQPLEIDSVNGIYNRVRFKCGPVAFDIVRNNSTIKYTPYLLDGIPLDAETQAFTPDSLNRWDTYNAPVFSIQFKDSLRQTDNIYWHPSTCATYYDSKLNDFPVEVFHICQHNVNISDETLEIYTRQDKVKAITTPHIKRGFRDSILYKDTYTPADTIPLLNISIKIDSIDLKNKTLYYEKIPHNISSIRLPAQIMEMFGDNLKEEDSYLIEFFGSWCAPCIEGLEELAKKRKNLTEIADILTIATEYNPDDFKLAENIFKSKHGDWKIIYEIIGEGNNEKLNIVYFPTYIIAGGNGAAQLISNDLKEILEYLE